MKRFNIGLGIVAAITLSLAASVAPAQARSPFIRTVVVTQNDLDNTSPNPLVVISDGLREWFMYNDSNDTIDNTLGSFVTGPATPPNGSSGSVQFTLSSSPNDRKDIATYQFAGLPLSAITTMSFTAYSASGVAGPDESPFLNFNVDFDGSSTWQKRLVYVPSANGAVAQDTWNSFDTIQEGNEQWTWSGYATNGNQWPDGNTAEYRTWNDILAAFPGVRILPTEGWLGIRVGEPGPSGYTGSIDSFTIGTRLLTTTYDFDPAAAPTITVNKHVIGRNDDGQFDLLIDGNVEASAIDNGGTTGAQEVSPGTHAVSEQAAGATDLADYAGSIVCLATNQHRIRLAAYSARTGSAALDVQPGDSIICTITNIRIPDWLQR